MSNPIVEFGQDLFNFDKNHTTDITKIRFTLYGFIPIAVPERVVERLGNLITTHKFDSDIGNIFSGQEVSKSIEHTVRVEGWLIGPLKKFWKILLTQLRNAQGRVAELGDKYADSLKQTSILGGGVADNRLSLFGHKVGRLPLPFVTDMTVEWDMLIKSLIFTHDNQFINSYRFTMELEKAQIAVKIRGSEALGSLVIRAGIASAAIAVSTAFAVAGLGVPLVPEIEPSPRNAGEVATIPSDMELNATVNMGPTLALGFDSTETWYKMPVDNGSIYPQHWKLNNPDSSDKYEMKFIIVIDKSDPLTPLYKMKLTVTKDSEKVFDQIIETGVTYKIDPDRNASNEAYYKLWFGFTDINVKVTDQYPFGSRTNIEGVTYFDSG